MRQIDSNRIGRAGPHRIAVVGAMIGLLASCAPGDIVGSAPLPSGLTDPAVTRTPAGAMAAYHGVLKLFNGALGGGDGNAPSDYVGTSGLLSDEFQNGDVLGAPNFGLVFGLDARVLPEQATLSNNDYEAPYSGLHAVRGEAQEVIGLLRDYAPDRSPALRGHVYALAGYSEVLLAEFFCSGIPLSTVDYGGDYTLKPGSSTSEVLQHALTLFDSALVLAPDSARIMSLVRVGRGRALLDLGQFSAARQAVAEVPDGYRYDVSYSAVGVGAVGGSTSNFALIAPTDQWHLTVSDGEGGNGLDYRSSGDPRTRATAIGPSQYGVMLYHPDKYSTAGDSPIVLADWVEARLIEAEAALQAGDVATWLATLNRLRKTAITPALPDTTDPGTQDARVDLLFRERAFWLFLTGHRQGDMRRLVRQYGRRVENVYPSGRYQTGSAFYGNDVTAPIPASERVGNPLFTGCLSRGA